MIEGSNIVRFKIKEEVKSYIKYGEWLGAPRKERFFTSPRVIVRQIVSGKPPKIFAGYTDKPLYFTQIGFAIIPKEKITPKILTALLNSKLFNFIHKYLYLDIEKELFPKILIENCKRLPIKKVIDHATKSNLTRKVNEMLICETNCGHIDQEIDQLVYKLYGLIEEEIAIVEQGA